MGKKDYIHGAYHKNLKEEIMRVLSECERVGIFLNKKEASAVVSEKSKKGMMNKKEVEEYVRKIKGLTKSLKDEKFN